MATHSSILAWEIPWREELGGLHSPWGSQRVSHDLPTEHGTHIINDMPTKVYIVKDMVFPVVTHSCKRWTTKKAEH